MSNNYQGMRWLKCDLQMQTPADKKHWQGEPLIEGKEQEAADSYAEACYETGLDVVGITEHNFLNRDFLPYLKIAFNNIHTKYGRKIILYPGFEFEAMGVGRGVHTLCLFEPGTPVEELDSILTECGIRFPRIKKNGQLEKSDKNLKDILRIVQEERGGIVIMPHATSNDGIFDNDSISYWVQQDQFTNPDLLAIEVPKPVHLMSKGYRKLIQSTSDCHPDWKRQRPIATLMSSDNKTLIEADGEGRPKPNSIGYRYSWIKMSEPSIESLRQAFLDPSSRIKLPEDVVTDKHPDSLNNYPCIKSIKIENAVFLDDQEIHFSPNKTCLIGGRGSGKSTVLEYLRTVLGKDSDAGMDPDSKQKAERIKKTTQAPGFKAIVEYQQRNGANYTLELSSDGVRVLGQQVIDLTTFLSGLPAQFFSQQQLNKITQTDDKGQLKSSEMLLRLVDGFVSDELQVLQESIKGLRDEIRHKQNLKKEQLNCVDKIAVLKQEIQGLEQQWQARKDVQADAETHEALKKEQAYLSSLTVLTTTKINQLKADVESYDQGFTSFVHEDTPHSAWFKQLDAKVLEANLQLKKNLKQLLDLHVAELESISSDCQWKSIEASIANSDAQFQQACESKGIQPEDIKQLSILSEHRSRKSDEILGLETQSKKLTQEAGGLEDLQGRLEEIWVKEYELRKQAAERANKLAVYENSDKSFVTVDLNFQGDKQHFLQIWEEFGPQDKRAKLARDWCDLIVDHVDAMIPNLNESFWAALDQRIKSDTTLAEVKDYIDSRPDEWGRLITHRIPDAIDITLYRSDGTEAGKISDSTLSDGQRNTAVLALLLAQDGGPLIIDQPEDELDSNFVFNELIPMIRRMKMKRQLIFATHNANLPVNGDADLLYAFEAKGGKGVCKAQGGLDRGDVTKAVLDIMEGSEKAFTRRREKYGF